MSIWFTEAEGDKVKVSFGVTKTLFSGKSEYQKVEVFETKAYGRMLTIDDFVMTTDVDEFVYHEMIAHVPSCVHPHPRKALVIGGGDGGTVRELLRHDSYEQITLCEIDQMVIDACLEYFPKISCGLKDPRVEVKVGDGIEYISTLTDELDVIIVDSTDPIGPGEGLFTGAFYKNVAKALKKDGIMVAQSESPWLEEGFLKKIQKNIRSGFENVAPYVGAVPTYPRGFWSWTMASNQPLDIESAHVDRLEKFSDELSYLTPQSIKGAFQLPPFFRRKLQL